MTIADKQTDPVAQWSVRAIGCAIYAATFYLLQQGIITGLRKG